MEIPAAVVAIAALELWLLCIVLSDGRQADAQDERHCRYTLQEWHERRYWKLSLWIGGLTMLSATGAAIAAYFAYSTSQDTERRELRAYVAMSGIVIETTGSRLPDGEYYRSANAVWQNSGATPTRGLIIFNVPSAKLPSGVLTSIISPDLMVLGAHEKDVMPDGVILELGGNLVMKGVATYRDAFGHKRVTLSCRFVSSTELDLNQMKPGTTVKIRSYPCETENCADQDCIPYKAEIETLGLVRHANTPGLLLPKPGAEAYQP